MKLRKLLYPLALIYGAVAALRRCLFRCGLKKTYIPEIPTIGVGNLSVGGTGKTPHVEYLTRLLSKNYNIATLSRGYRRESRGFVLANELPAKQVNVQNIGDEPLQFHTKFPSLKVAVDEKRKDGIEQLCRHCPDLQAIILDDCYQHLPVTPHCRILITEYEAPYCDDLPLPAGNLREMKTAARFADIIIVSKCPEYLSSDEANVLKNRLKPLANQKVFFTKMVYGNPYGLNSSTDSNNIDQNTEVVLLTAIAHPEPLVDYCKNHYKLIKHYRFPDHHYFSEEELQNIKNQYFNIDDSHRILLTTEKDSMRLLYNENLKDMVAALPLFALPIEPCFLFDGGDTFDEAVRDVVSKM